MRISSPAGGSRKACVGAGVKAGALFLLPLREKVDGEAGRMRDLFDERPRLRSRNPSSDLTPFGHLLPQGEKGG